MKYAHLADLHLGGWREPKMRELSLNAFLGALDQCLENKVDFIIFAGDLFNTALPSLDTLKIATKKLKELKDKNIPLYVIPGSHDFSPSGKTMIDVLENAGLLINVCKGQVDPETKQLKLKFTVDQKTGAKITGILGRKGQLDSQYYQNLCRENLEQEPGYKIFLFHTTLSELKPPHLDFLESSPASFLPKNFSYYAGGHVHHPNKIELEDHKTLTYPGALFPNNFAEVEKYSHGGYYLITVENEKQQISWQALKIKEHLHLEINCEQRSPQQVTDWLLEQLKQKEVTGKIITLRLEGKLLKGKVSDINFKEIVNYLCQQEAFFVMKNTAKLYSEDFEEIKIRQTDPELIEEEIIKEHLQQISLFDKDREFDLTKQLIHSLNTSKKESENKEDFLSRIEEEVNKLLRL